MILVFLSCNFLLKFVKKNKLPNVYTSEEDI